MASVLKHELGLETELVVGRSGEFTVWLGETMVAEKTWRGFPEADDVVDAVRDATAAPTS